MARGGPTLLAPPMFGQGPLPYFPVAPMVAPTARIIPVAHTTTNTAQTWTCGSNTTTGGGTIDNALAWLPGDVMILIAAEGGSTGTPTGAKGSFTPAANAGTRIAEIEGNSDGVMQNSVWAPDNTLADVYADGSALPVPRITYIWSTRIGRFAGTTIGNLPTVTVTVTQSTAPQHRAFLYCLRPYPGFTIPDRTLRRVVATFLTATTIGAGVTDTVPLTWHNGTVRKGQEALLVAVHSDAGSNGIIVDADGDSAGGANTALYELNADDFAVTNSTTSVSHAYVRGEPKRPNTTVYVQHVASPGANGHVTSLVVYSAEPEGFPSGFRRTGLAMKASGDLRTKTYLDSRHRGALAMKAHGRIRSKYLQPGAHHVALAMKFHGRLKTGKLLSGVGRIAMEAFGVLNKPQPMLHRDQLIPPGMFVGQAPTSRLFEVRTAIGPSNAYVIDAETLTFTEVEVGVSFSHADSVTGNEAQNMALLEGDTATATDTPTRILIADIDSAGVTEAVVMMNLASSDTFTESETESVTFASDTGQFFHFFM